jgi:hypothetical protein
MSRAQDRARIVFDCRIANDPAMIHIDAMERTPIQYAAGTLAGSAFIATTQILTGVALDVPLYVALVAFAINIPFQIIIFLMPVPTIRKIEHLSEQLHATPQKLSWPLRLYFSALVFSTRFIIIGFIAMFWHFAWWLGVLFALAAWAAYEIFHRSALEDYKQRPDEYE